MGSNIIKRVLKDLIADATATKDAIDEAYDSIENANEAVKHAPQMTAMMPTPAPANDSDFFGGWGSDAPAQVPLPNSYDSNHEDIPTPREPDSQPQSMTVAPHAPTNNGKDNNAVEYSQPAPTSSYSSYDGNNDSSPSYVMPVPAPTTDMYSGGGYTLERGVLNREASEGFGEVMGGGPVPSLLNQGMISPSMGGTMLGSSTFDSVPVAVSMKEAEDLRSKSREADDLAQEAEASRKQMVAHLEELRKVADDAENKARSAADKPVKKKGLLGRSGVQKKDAVC